MVLPILIALFFLMVGGLICGRSCLGPRATVSTYVPATADGSWKTMVNLLTPQITTVERYRSDCEADVNCTVVAGTCQMQERTDQYTERKVDEYDDYAYNIYYEETESAIYEASAGDFVVTELNENDDRWEGERHYVSKEWLDKETCQYTEYTVWITDPDDPDYDIEVVLSECEVWDHVVVTEKVYEQDEYCQAEIVGAMVLQNTLTQQGTGITVGWSEADVPPNGELERVFEGTVVFQAEGATRTVRVTNVEEYIRYLATQYYLGLDEKGNVVRLTDQAP